MRPSAWVWRGAPGGGAWSWSSVDMIGPVPVLGDLAPHGGGGGLLDLLGDGTGPAGADLAVIDGADRHHLGRRAREEGLLGQVEVGTDDRLMTHLDPEVLRNGLNRLLGDA